MANNAKPSNPMDSVLIPGQIRRALPDSGAGERKATVVPGERMSAGRPVNDNPAAVEAREAARKWLEKKRAQREKAAK